MTPIKLILIRHGESEGNVDKLKHSELADHAISLSATGRKQARLAGEWLGNYFLRTNTPETRTRFWVSPYARTRQTADEIIHGLNAVSTRVGSEHQWKLAYDAREHINLVEQQFGLFDGIPEN